MKQTISVICITYFPTAHSADFSLPKIILKTENIIVKRDLPVKHTVFVPLTPYLLSVIQFWHTVLGSLRKFCRNRKQNRRSTFHWS